MSGVLRLGNTGAATGRSTIQATATSDATFSLPSAGGTLLTSNYSAVGTITLDGSTVNITNGDLNVDSGTLFVDESTNQVGIGTTSPSKLLEVSSGTNNGPVIRLNNANTSVNNNTEYGRIEWNTNDVSAGGTGISNYIAAHAENAGVLAALTFGVRDGSGVSEVMRISSSGRLLLGGATSGAYDVELKKSGQPHLLIGSTNALGATLLLDGDANGDGIGSDYASLTHFSDGNLILENRKTASILFRNTSSSTTRMVIDSNGDVGIGTVDPNAILHTSTNATDAITLYLENRADAGSADKNGIAFVLRRAGGYAFAGTRIRAEKENAWTGTPSTINSAITFSTYDSETASERLRIQSGGGISFNGDTAQANALDDYEEGDWSNSIGYRGYQTAGTYTLSDKVAYYTKIGNQVTVYGRITVTGSGGTSYAEITGLPFSYKASSRFTGAVWFRNWTTGLSGTIVTAGVTAPTSGQSNTILVAITRDNNTDLNYLPVNGFHSNNLLAFTFSYTVS
jgi:hypothetical protein